MSNDATPAKVRLTDGLGAAVPTVKVDQMEIAERGPWSAGETEDKSRAFVQSDDFTHDARLYVNGDFGDRETRIAYAKEIAKRLNAWRPPRTGSAHSCDIPGCAVCDPCHGL